MKTFKDILHDSLRTPMSIKEIMGKFKSYSRKDIENAIRELEDEGLILKNKKKSYARSEYYGMIVCKYLATEKAFAFGAPIYQKDSEDIFIPPNQSKNAWHNDTVMLKLNPKPQRGRRTEGKVVSILSRDIRSVVGSLQKDGKAYVVAGNKRFPPIEVSPKKLAGAELGDRVEVKITFYGDDKHPALGVISKVFGASTDMQAVIESILHQNGIFEEFPKAAINQAEHIGQTVKGVDGREDLRDKVIFTIDGDTAKDFDDAVSLEMLENGRMLLGVHIADVSHYVTEDSALDDEAVKRGTSVYFANKVVPMLPFELSNGICSLNPKVDRYTFSGFIETDSSGRVYNTRFCKSVINSKERMTYNNVNKILEGDKELCEKYSHIVEVLHKMNDLAINMRKNRMMRGALELDIPESQIVCDDTGACIDVVIRTRGQSEMLIEEFMLACNEAAAEFMLKSDYPAVYRVHENPDPNKLKIFASFARMFGHKIPKGQEDNTHVLGDVLKNAKGNPEEKVLSVMLLRSLARARYSSECLGHFGLSSKFYLHFTSPIRRYPDLVTHRMMEALLSGVPAHDDDFERLEDIAKQCSAREIAADTAERDTEKLYMAQYMRQHLGEEFEGVVSSVQSYGMFIELPNTIEGLVRVENMNDDYYIYNEEKLSLIGKRTGKKYTIGSIAKVKLVASSEITGQIDFDLV